MKKNNIYLAAAAALLALVACNKESAPEAAGDITIDACIGAMTKVSYDGATTSFTAGDQIAVYAWMGSAAAVPDTRVVDGVLNTLGTDDKWTPATQMRWKTVTDAHYFLGVYPAKDITNFTADAYTLDPATYTASDLLIATNLTGVKATDGTVALNFDHTMAKLNVNLKFRSQWDATPTVTSVTVTAKKTASVNYLTKAVTVTATEAPAPVDIPAAATAATGYALSFSGLQVPQTGVTTVTVTIAGKTYVYESATDIPLESGKYTTLGLIVGKDKLELGSISVTDWEAGTTLPDGDAMLSNKHNGHEYVDMGEVDINGVKKHLYWATCNIGADNPWDYGDYYSWGATATKDTYTWGNYAFMQDGQADWKHITKYTVADGKTDAIWYDGGGIFIGDGKTSFADYDYADDAARQVWGGDWRIPTDAEWTALRNTTLYDWVWTTDYNGSGKNGMLVTRKTGPCSGNSIFLPAAGYRYNASLNHADSYGVYWSSSLDTGYSVYACYVYFFSGGVYHESDLRCCGRSLRPVFCEHYPLAAADVATIDIGRVLAADGNIYADADQASAAGTTAVAMIAYVGSETGSTTYNHGLAIALADESGTMNWSTAKSTCEGKAAVTGAKWYLPSNAQWQTMFSANGGNNANWSGLNTTITAAGGTGFVPGEFYWSSTGDTYVVFLFSTGNVGYTYDTMNVNYARACLAF